MNKRKIIITIISIIVVGLIAYGGVTIYNNSTIPDLEIDKNIFGLEWGMSQEEVEKILWDNNIYKNDDEFIETQYLDTFYFEDLKLIKGANGSVVCRFEDGKLYEVYFFFDSQPSSKHRTDESAMKPVWKMFKKTNNNAFGKANSLYNYYKDKQKEQEGDYIIDTLYWYNESTLAEMSMHNNVQLFVTYSDRTKKEDLIKEYDKIKD